MADTPDDYTEALARERAGYMASGKPERALLVDEQLEAQGWSVDEDGKLVRPKAKTKADTKIGRAPREHAVAPKAPENTDAD